MKKKIYPYLYLFLFSFLCFALLSGCSSNNYLSKVDNYLLEYSNIGKKLSFYMENYNFGDEAFIKDTLSEIIALEEVCQSMKKLEVEDPLYYEIDGYLKQGADLTLEALSIYKGVLSSALSNEDIYNYTLEIDQSYDLFLRAKETFLKIQVLEN